MPLLLQNNNLTESIARKVAFGFKCCQCIAHENIIVSDGTFKTSVHFAKALRQCAIMSAAISGSVGPVLLGAPSHIQDTFHTQKAFISTSNLSLSTLNKNLNALCPLSVYNELQLCLYEPSAPDSTQ